MPHRSTKPPPIFAFVLLAIALYLIIRRPDTGFLGWFLRGAMIVLSLAQLAIWWLTRGIATDPAGAADDIVRMQQALYSETHEYRTVQPNEIRGLDIAFYDRTQQYFQTQQFKHLGDIEDLTATREFPKMRTFIRVMSGDGGATQLAIYHVKMRGFYRLLQTFNVLPKNLKMVDLETELSDSSFMVTANSQGSDTTGAVPGVVRFQHSLDTGAADLLKLHREQVEQAIRRDPALQPVLVNTLDELIASQHRLQAIKNAHKASIGYMDAKEFRQIAGSDSAAARDLAAEFERRKHT
jgi:hypothetical protein